MTSSVVARYLKKIVDPNVLSEVDIRKILKRVTLDKNIPEIEEPKGCWFYSEDWSQYVTFKKKPLHRLMFRIFEGEIYGDNFICHKCDRPGCINPEHLYQGTAKDNHSDKVNRGRWERNKINYRINSLELDQLRKRDQFRRLIITLD